MRGKPVLEGFKSVKFLTVQLSVTGRMLKKDNKELNTNLDSTICIETWHTTQSIDHAKIPE